MFSNELNPIIFQVNLTTNSKADIFWIHWLREYLPSLINRRKWSKDEPNIEKSELVAINENDFPRGVWYR